jgi:hypothetical protein
MAGYLICADGSTPYRKYSPSTAIMIRPDCARMMPLPAELAVQPLKQARLELRQAGIEIVPRHQPSHLGSALELLES